MWQFLYFLPLPQGHGSLRPTFSPRLRIGSLRFSLCAAFVVLRADVPDEQLAAFASERLARFKVPKTFHRVDELPRNSMGKVQKSELANA